MVEPKRRDISALTQAFLSDLTWFKFMLSKRFNLYLLHFIYFKNIYFIFIIYFIYLYFAPSRRFFCANLFIARKGKPLRIAKRTGNTELITYVKSLNILFILLRLILSTLGLHLLDVGDLLLAAPALVLIDKCRTLDNSTPEPKIGLKMKKKKY